MILIKIVLFIFRKNDIHQVISKVEQKISMVIIGNVSDTVDYFIFSNDLSFCLGAADYLKEISKVYGSIVKIVLSRSSVKGWLDYII